MQTVNRGEYVQEYRDLAEQVIEKEKLPFASDLLDFALEDKKSERLQYMFDFFDNEEELKGQITRTSLTFSDEESKEFIDSVIAANISDISESGTIYKYLQASGDSFRVRGKDCHSKGREVALPLDETGFTYHVKNCNAYFDDPNNLVIFDNYESFKQACEGHDKIFVRSPISCKLSTKKGCCPVCAGELPEGIQNLGAFSTLMITEVATQNALSSMNKGKKKNVNTLLTLPAKNEEGKDISSLKEFYEWSSQILEDLEGDKVERRFYEIAFLSRLKTVDLETGKVKVASLSNPDSENYFGEFIYHPKEKAFRNMLSNSPFLDDSLKSQIALNSYSRKKY
jgi:hypothetical protein